MTEWFFKLTMYIYTNTKCSATLSCFLQQLTMKYKLETNKSNISGELSTFIMNWFWYVSITTEKKKTDNFSVDVIYFRFWIVYTCGIQSVSTVNRPRQMSECDCLQCDCLIACLYVPVSAWLCTFSYNYYVCTDSTSMYNYVCYPLLGSGVMIYVLLLCYVC